LKCQIDNSPKQILLQINLYKERFSNILVTKLTPAK
jgi:hypothetical protein